MKLTFIISTDEFIFIDIFQLNTIILYHNLILHFNPWSFLYQFLNLLEFLSNYFLIYSYYYQNSNNKKKILI